MPVKPSIITGPSIDPFALQIEYAIDGIIRQHPLDFRLFEDKVIRHVVYALDIMPLVRATENLKRDHPR